MLIEHLPSYITAITGLVMLWFNRPRKKRAKSTAITIEVGGLKIEGPLDDPNDAKRAIAVLRSIARR